ncbi:MAG: AAA family ATPase [Gammaproteobacteria bacterium]|jgi:chromosome partitioning protein
MLTVIGNLKGGSGKSTVAFNLGVWLAKAHQEPMCFDLDPQSTLSDVAEVRHEEGHQPEIQVFRAADDPAELIKHHKGEVLVDVGAANLWAMRQAVNMADRIVVPVTPSQADVWSTQRFLAIVAEALKAGHSPEIWGFINRADTHSSVRETAETEKALSMLPGLLVQKVRLGQRTAFRRSFSEGLAVFELERAGKAAQEFNRLAELLFPRVKKIQKSKALGR